MKNFWNFRRANFKQRPTFFIISFLLVSMLWISQSCNKDISSIGLDLQDDLLNASFTDSVTLTAYSVRDDSLSTAGLVFNYLGCMNDEIFGTTIASIYTQFIPSGNNVNFGDSPKLDSIVLILKYTGGFYGDTLNPFAIKVYELKDEISKDTIYKQYHIIDHFGNLTYKDFYLTPKPNTKVKLDTYYEAHVRIRLSDELGNRFLDKKNKDELANEDKFKNFFKGLLIQAEPSRNAGSLVNFSLTHALSGIQLYYKDDSDARKQFSFIVKNESTVRFSNYKHDYLTGNPEFYSQVFNEDTVRGEKMLYVQSMGGVKTKITFPHIKEFKSRNIAINKAELVITNIGDNLDRYPQPARLSIQAVKKQDNKLVIIPDALTGNPAYFGGEYNDKKEYRFRITRYLQEIIQKDNYQPYIYLVTEGYAAYASRLILCGTDTTLSSRLRLEVYYTEY